MTSDEILKWRENVADDADMEGVATRCLLEIAHQLAKLNEQLDTWKPVYVEIRKQDPDWIAKP